MTHYLINKFSCVWLAYYTIFNCDWEQNGDEPLKGRCISSDSNQSLHNTGTKFSARAICTSMMLRNFLIEKIHAAMWTVCTTAKRIGQRGPDDGKECMERTADGVKTVKRMVPKWKTIKNAT